MRWTGSELPRLAFFKNLVLIAALLGGGIGIAAGARRPGLARLTLPLLALFALALPRLGAWPRLLQLRFGGKDEFIWDLSTSSSSSAVDFFLFFIVVFAATLALFIGFGAAIGRVLARAEPLPGYLANLVGSLLGVLGFALVSWAGMGPLGWFLCLALPLGFGLAPGRRGLALAVVVAGLGFAAERLSQPARWSPYNRVAIESFALRDAGDVGYNLAVNRAYFMTLIDLARPAEGFSRLAAARRHYDLPYRFAAANSVLVLGAGGGNDVAAALRAGATRIDAVEIDPVILRAGVELHPERPYAAPGVRVIVDDARSWLRRSPERYDLIVLGLLDSHAAVSGLPGVRLDNWVYTVESMRAARARLSERGILALSFAIPPDRPWLALKIANMLEQAFGAPPLVFDVGYDVSYAFLAGNGLGEAPALRAAAELSERRVTVATIAAAAGEGAIAVPTDDWPHLYLRARGIPPAQLLLVGLLLALALVVTRGVVRVAGTPDLQAALLGAGFLLVETRGIADLGLLFGGTWWTVLIAITAILAMAALATLVVLWRRPRSSWPAYLGLGVALLAGTAVRPEFLLELGAGTGPALGALLVAAPVFFSGIVFATALARAENPAHFLGSNLEGAVFGGFLEYASLSWGIRSLGLIALAIYALSALIGSRSGLTSGTRRIVPPRAEH